MEADGKGHEQYLQVRTKTGVRLRGGKSVFQRGNEHSFSPRSLYSTLLAHKKEHIRKFAAESFSFLMRKVSCSLVSRCPTETFFFFLCLSCKVRPFCDTQVPDIDALLSHVFSDLQQHPDKAEGTGQLLFEMCKGVRNMFHSCVANVSCPRSPLFSTKR